MKNGIKIIALLAIALLVSCAKNNPDVAPIISFSAGNLNTRIYISPSEGEYPYVSKWISTENPVAWNIATINDINLIVSSHTLSVNKEYAASNYCKFTSNEHIGIPIGEDYISFLFSSQDLNTNLKANIYKQDEDWVIYNRNITYIPQIQQYYDNKNLIPDFWKDLVNSSSIHMYTYAKKQGNNVHFYYQQLFSIIRVGITSSIPKSITHLTIEMLDTNKNVCNCTGIYKLHVNALDLNKFYIERKRDNIGAVTCQFNPDINKYNKSKEITEDIRYFNAVIFPDNYAGYRVTFYNNQEVICTKTFKLQHGAQVGTVNQCLINL